MNSIAHMPSLKELGNRINDLENSLKSLEISMASLQSTISYQSDAGKRLVSVAQNILRRVEKLEAKTL